VVIVHVIEPVLGFRSGRGRCSLFLLAIKIRSTTSLGGAVKPAVTSRKIFGHVTDPYSMKR
jgi:hypothetical protein